MKLLILIEIGVQNSCTPISIFVPPNLPVKGYKNAQSKISVDTLGKICLGYVEKYCGKRRTCWIAFPVMCSEAFYLKIMKAQNCMVKS